MNTDLQAFQFQTHQLTVVTDEVGAPWFIAKEVAEILEYSDAFKMTSKLDDDEVKNRQIGGFGNRGVNIINESGLYSSILTSKKPAAKVFKKWVTSEVLPSIHKTGGYGIAHETFKLSFTPEELEDLVNRRVTESSISLQNKYIALLEQENSRLKASEPLVVGLPRKWSAADDQTLLALKAQGLGYTRIGYRLGRSGNSIKHRYTRLMAQGGAQ